MKDAMYLLTNSAPAVDMSRCDLLYGILAGADLRGVKFYKSNLHGCDLRGTNLSDTDFFKAHLEEVLYDDTTIWEEGFSPKIYGAVHISELGVL